MKVIFVLIFFIMSLSDVAFAQKSVDLQFGLGYYFNNSFYLNEVVDGIAIRSTGDGLDGYKIQCSMDYQLSERIAVSGELFYTLNVGTAGPIIQLENVSMLNDSLHWLNSMSPSFNTIELYPKIRFKLSRNIEPYVGIGMMRVSSFEKTQFQYLDENNYDEEFRSEVRRINYQNSLIESVENSIRKYTVNGSVGLRVWYKKFNLELAYERTLTPLSNRLNFEGRDHDFYQYMARYSVSIGYRFYTFEKTSN